VSGVWDGVVCVFGWCVSVYGVYVVCVCDVCVEKMGGVSVWCVYLVCGVSCVCVACVSV